METGDTANQYQQAHQPMSPAGGTLAEQPAHNLVGQDVLLTTYQVIASRRVGYNTMIWQVPALGLTAQAFLFTAALSANDKAQRDLAALLALVIALISMQLMARHRYHEELDSRLLEEIETQLGLVKTLGFAPHASSRRRAAAICRLASGDTSKPVKTSAFTAMSSYRLWLGGLSLFALAAAGIIASTFLNLSPLIQAISARLGK